MKILVTGANGYLGARLSKHLAEQGHNVIALIRRIPPNSDSWLNYMADVVIGDIRDRRTLEKIVNMNPESAVHTISLDHKASRDKNFEEVLHINVKPSLDLLKILTKKGLDRFVFFSTQQVYGKTDGGNISENHKTSPVNVYGLTHLMSENICNYFNEITDTKCISIRLSNGYGPPVFHDNNCWWLVINDFCRSAYRQGKIKLSSDGSPQRDFINITDICRAVSLILDKDRKLISYDCYNVGSGKTCTILSLAHLVAKTYGELFGQQVPVSFEDGTVSAISQSQDSIAKTFHYNINRISSFGFEPAITIEDGLVEMLRYLERCNDTSIR